MQLARYLRLIWIVPFYIASPTLRAEQGVLVLHVANPQTRPIPGVVLSTRGDGSVGPPTDRAGKTRIRLAPQTKPHSWVSLQLARAPQDLVFISPWDNRVRVPPFENESDNFAPVVLAERGDRTLLEMGKALASLAARINAASAPKDANTKSPGEQRQTALAEVSRLFGLDRDELDRALRSLRVKSKDPYEKGMSALYERAYPEAERSLEASLEARDKRLKRVPAGIVNSAFFLGQALFEQQKYAEAADAYRKALKLRPDDPRILDALGRSLLNAGKPAEAEPFLRRALELQEAPSN